jgi:hypothetical protein
VVESRSRNGETLKYTYFEEEIRPTFIQIIDFLYHRVLFIYHLSLSMTDTHLNNPNTYMQNTFILASITCPLRGVVHSTTVHFFFRSAGIGGVVSYCTKATITLKQ